MTEFRIADALAQELALPASHIATALELLAAGNTVPFIARYRKEATGGLDDTQLRLIEQRSAYLMELHDRKLAILKAIEEQGKLTDTLRSLIVSCDTKSRLEDLYLPYKKRRVTKADIARQAGLEPLLDQILEQCPNDPEPLATAFITEGFADAKAVLAGARAIFVDRCALDADLVGELREMAYQQAHMRASVIAGQEAGVKYQDYFDFAEKVTSLPSHRILALFRGETEGVLHLNLDAGEEAGYLAAIARSQDVDLCCPWIADAVLWGWKTKLYLSAALDIRMRLKETAETGALEVFARNLRDVLLAAPAGQRATLGLDPGYRNGVKCAVVDTTGKVLETFIIYPHQPQQQWDQARQRLATAVATHGVELLAIGNGTASRETEKLAREVAALIHQAGGKRPIPVVVSESGASVYSASELAAKEFPNMDVSLRGAVSIARRLQDPLAELVKIDPKAIGVGQYQHDVNQVALAKTLDDVVEDAVNAVGVDLNTASVPLLAKVAGISHTLAENIVAYRDEHGQFDTRAKLKKVPRLGPKAFEQCAGFLRIHNGTDPLDASAVHPEAYPVVRRIAAHTGLELPTLIGNTKVLSTLQPATFADDNFGIPTITDILTELEKPGRDPRPEFTTATFQEGVETIADLRPGMILEGTVTNVAAFGAFVDIGVHQDGLVHISALSHNYVADPHTIVHSGAVVKVKVLEVDVARKRISLSMRLDDDPTASTADAKTSKPAPKRAQTKRREQRNTSAQSGSLADALRRAGFKP
ncbi:Tex family protein [Corynebacterium sp. HS2168-gen11]|uniref:Tex family protein n=1 Tax=Corynebacterium sp. HS2168-gen11 TaxID=2974027 RepID=UPI00216B4802|nr:Tex family protein [Corynebacterium sp. HS2168-gen11]MCS4536279.1 RNA-binding transcriptional accessory protein [Corynebacterium sp. HS2168-gen11]